MTQPYVQFYYNYKGKHGKNYKEILLQFSFCKTH